MIKIPKIRPIALGLTLGIVLGLYTLFIGLSAAWLNWGTPIVQLLSSLYIGYSATFAGAIIGFIWAFVDGFVCGLLIAWIYNAITKK